MCRKSRLRTFMKLARMGELIASKAYGRASRLAEKAKCDDVVKTISGLSKSEIVHANLCTKVIDALSTKKSKEEADATATESKAVENGAEVENAESKNDGEE